MTTPVRPNLTIDISENDNDNQQQTSSPQQQLNIVDGGSRDPKTPPGVRGHSDIRAPGFAKTPLNADINNGGVNRQGFTNELDPINSLSLENTTTNSPSNLLSTNNNNNTEQQVEEPRSPLADFITQTDKYGNASTPRSATAIQTARKLHPEGPKPVLHVENGALTEDTTGAGRDDSSDGDGAGKALLSPSDKEKALQIEAEKNVPVGGEDACDTLLDNFRMMCCCLLPEDSAAPNSDTANNQGGDNNLQKSTHSTSSTENSDHNATNTQNTSIGPHGSYPLGYSTRGHDAPLLLEEDSALRNNPRKIKLLPNLDYTNPNYQKDVGKKCLVLDLDETLVHSSFRAVPGADFVIPVQVRFYIICLLFIVCCGFGFSLLGFGGLVLLGLFIWGY